MGRCNRKNQRPLAQPIQPQGGVSNYLHMRKPSRTKALYAGSFDPVTRGHLDIIDKALMTFDAVHIAIGTNVRKTRTFGVEESQRLIFQSIVERWPEAFLDAERRSEVNSCWTERWRLVSSRTRA
jgi:cytidyltransferase-like protein